MSFLTQGFPNEAGGCAVHTDFRLWLEFERDLERIATPADIVGVLHKYYVTAPQGNPLRALSALIGFYSGSGRKRTAGGAGGGGTRAYDYEVDAPLIYAAFLSQYGLDLTTVTLHWHGFLALFRGLDESHKISKIMEYRSVNPADIKDKSQKRFYQKMKRLYRLPSRKITDDMIGTILSEAF